MGEKKMKRNDHEMREICKLSPEDVCRETGSANGGLTPEEAAARQRRYGKNVIKEAKGKPVILVFLSSFISLMAILLWAGGIIAFVAKIPELGFAIWLVNIINGVFSFWQEYRAGKATNALKKMLPSYTNVIRDNREQQILAEDLVPGDIMVFSEGDKISADARLISSNDLQVNQSTLTGESNPVRRTHDSVLREDMSIYEIPNLIFAGTSVSSGTGRAVVVSTGMDTEFGKIANLTQTVQEEQSPLEKELDRLTKQVSFIAVGFGVAFFTAAIFIVHQPFAQAFIFSLGMIVAFIPEGLLPTVTLSLAMAVQRMAKEHALVKRLSAVETLGCTTVICSDKTGTLTQNEMTVTNLWTPEAEYKVTGLGYAPVGDIMAGDRKVTAADNKGLKLLLKGASLCSNARVVPPDGGSDKYTVLGDPTEACLGVAAKKAGLNPEDMFTSTPRLRELPFDSRRKRMTTINQLKQPVDGTWRIAYVKGSPKEVLELCSGVFTDGGRHEITDEQRKRIMAANDGYARRGLRVLAVAYRLLKKNDNLPSALSAYTSEMVEQDLTFVGLTVMMDPPRPEVAKAVDLCHKADIRIIMITGDYGLTAESIAKHIGIVNGDHPRIISGIELQNMQDDELKKALQDEVIFARVAPEQKFRVVSNLQEMGHIVAVTGDGVNDSPALKKADIGIAMGMTGTDVAKEAADMILTDDNFASIVKAIGEGRAVYSNIRKFLLYILCSNMPEAVPSAFFLFSRGRIPLPLTVMQILLVDLGTDMMPALGLGMELPEKGVMDRPPRRQSEPLLNKHVAIKGFLWYGMMESAFSMLAYFYVNKLNGWPAVPLAGSGTVYAQATTMALASIVFCQAGMVLNCRTQSGSLLEVGLFSNKQVVRGIVFEILLISAIIYVPFLQDIFQTASIGARDWLFLIMLPLIVVLVEELRKYFMRKCVKIK
ncbi:cation-transporting P-type ATPase [Eubacteriales bacterium mix99]